MPVSQDKPALEQGPVLPLASDNRISFWRRLANGVAFAFRRAAYEKRGVVRQYHEPAEDKTPLYQSGIRFPELTWLKKTYTLSPHLLERLWELTAQYPLSDFSERSTRLRWLESLTILDFLDSANQALPLLDAVPAQGVCRWLDVGCKNWAYIDAQWAFLQRHQMAGHLSSFRLDGVELDGYRRYSDGFTRADYAEAYLAALPKTSQMQAAYHLADIRAWQAPVELTENQESPALEGDLYHVITCFLPFVFAGPHAAWGLPAEYFDPLQILRRMLDLLAPGGILMIINQGQDEAEAQHALFDACRNLGYRLEILPLGEFSPSFLPYQYPRYGTLCRKL